MKSYLIIGTKNMLKTFAAVYKLDSGGDYPDDAQALFPREHKPNKIIVVKYFSVDDQYNIQFKLPEHWEAAGDYVKKYNEYLSNQPSTKFKVGEWVVFDHDNVPPRLRTTTWNSNLVLKINKICEKELYFENEYSRNIEIASMSHSIIYFRNATIEEIKAELLRRATLKGFKEGCTITRSVQLLKSYLSDSSHDVESYEGEQTKRKLCSTYTAYETGTDSFIYFGFCIYSNGHWAEIFNPYTILKFGELEVSIKDGVATTKHGDISINDIESLMSWMQLPPKLLGYELRFRYKWEDRINDEKLSTRNMIEHNGVFINEINISFGCANGTVGELKEIYKEMLKHTEK